MKHEKRLNFLLYGITIVLVIITGIFLGNSILKDTALKDAAPIEKKSHKGMVTLEQTGDRSLHRVWAEEILSGMTLEEKVSQMFIVRCPQYHAKEKAAEYQPGGYLLFARDFRSEDSMTITDIIKGYQSVMKIKMLVGVDEEGGVVRRISGNSQYGWPVFQSPQALYQEGGFEGIETDTKEKADLLLSLGINVNFAPVCDVSINPSDYIYNRTLGQGPEMTAVYTKTVVNAMKQKGIGSVLKHFPGYGNNVDTHMGGAVDSRSYEDFVNCDFIPFQAGIQAGANAVLVSHNRVLSMDEYFPASLSPAVHEVLRNTLQFNGVVITDDLVMDAIRDFATEEEAAVLAVEAGNDLLCSSNFEVQIPAVLGAVHSGRIPESRIDASVIRILCWKQKLGIIPPKEDFRPLSSFLEESERLRQLQPPLIG